MARKTKHESELTRARILDAAEVEMEARGVSRTSLDRIARRAEVTRGAIYWHFADKHALLEAMIARTHLPLRELRLCLAEHIPGNEPLRLLREIMLHGLLQLSNDPQHRRVCHIVMHRCESIQDEHPADDVMRAMFDEARSVLHALCAEIASNGKLHASLTVDDATDVMLAFMCGNYDCVLRHPYQYDPERDWRPMLDGVLRGVFDVSTLPEHAELSPLLRAT